MAGKIRDGDDDVRLRMSEDKREGELKRKRVMEA